MQMQSLAVVLEEPRALWQSASFLLDAPGPPTSWWRRTGQRRERRDGAAALHRTDADVSRHGLSARARLRDGRPRRRGRRRTPALAVGAACSCPARAASAPCAGCMAARPRISSFPALASSRVDASLGERGVLLALAATALHAVEHRGRAHEGRRWSSAMARSAADRAPRRSRGGRAVGRLGDAIPRARDGAQGYAVLAPEDDARRDYQRIIDVSGDAAALDSLIQRLAPRRRDHARRLLRNRRFRLSARPSCARREFRIAAQWAPGDLGETIRLVETGASVARRAHHPPLRSARGGGGLSRRF